jgi:tRNA(fMet)-specific endonuclease VapC
VKYLLDTDHISILQSRKGVEFKTLSERIAPRTSEVVCCIISYHEQVIGAHAYLNRAQGASELRIGYERLNRLFLDYSARPVLSFDHDAAKIFENLRGRIRVSVMDLRIAAIALSRGLTLLTRNRRDFDKIANLRTEDWTNRA